MMFTFEMAQTSSSRWPKHTGMLLIDQFLMSDAHNHYYIPFDYQAVKVNAKLN